MGAKIVNLLFPLLTEWEGSSGNIRLNFYAKIYIFGFESNYGVLL